jgi:hypothetical protein
MHKALISSSYFTKSYAIFIARGASRVFNEHIRARLWNSTYKIRLLDAEFDPELSCIVIPSDLNFAAFEKELFDLKNNHKNTFVKESQFWGQLGIGYDGKQWTIV